MTGAAMAEAGRDGAACSAPGEPTPGPADTHCIGDDGGLMVQLTSEASCHPDAVPGDDGGGDQCPYGATMYGGEAPDAAPPAMVVGDDDDCKYHVVWSSTPICEGTAGVSFTVTATYLGTGMPLTGAGTKIEAFTTSSGDWDADSYCDNTSAHPTPSGGLASTTEGPPGTYAGQVQFDRPGPWTVRFHFHEDCDDTLDDSPHGHAAFHITVP